jgi:hypothetical protein
MSTKAQAVEMKLEIVVIPVSDVDRAKLFYGSLIRSSSRARRAGRPLVGAPSRAPLPK